MTAAQPGPRRPSTQPALPPARARVAALLDELGANTTLAALAERVGGHPNATRAHLDALVQDGRATAQPLPRSGPGRPALGWTLTADGRRAIAGDPSTAAYAEIVQVMVSHLAEVPESQELAHSIGVAWGTERVDDPSREALIGVLADLGFDPEEDGDTIRLRACPILDAATEHPEVVCAIHQGLVSGASGSTGVRLLPFAEPGACRIDVA
ncbi:MAG TPA: transcriptional regulator [Propionibacterium sp.]|nr:transcriptional regulator [Propionibacterium sp.]